MPKPVAVIHCDKPVGVLKTVFSTGQYSYVSPDDPYYTEVYQWLGKMQPPYFRSHNHYNDDYADQSGLDDFQIVEPYPPTDAGCQWDFSELDKKLADELAVCDRDTFVYNIRTCPPWMLDKSASAPLFPGTSGVVKDKSYQQLADFCARVVAWYNKGGFADELGVFHRSGHYYGIRYWELLNEQDAGESAIYIQDGAEYARAFDAISRAIRAVDPLARCGGPAQSCVPTERHDLTYLEQFMAHVQEPVDFLSLHFYSDQSGLLTPAGAQRLPDAKASMQAEQHYFSAIDDIGDYLAAAMQLAARYGGLPVMLSETNVCLDEYFDEPLPSGAFSQGSYGVAWFGSLYAHAARAGIEVVQQYQFYSPAGRSTHLKNSLSYIDNQSGQPHMTYHLACALQRWFPADGVILAADSCPEAELLAVMYPAQQCIRLLAVNKAVPIDKDARFQGENLTMELWFDSEEAWACEACEVIASEKEPSGVQKLQNGEKESVFSLTLKGYGALQAEFRRG